MYTEQALRKRLKTSVFGNKIYTFETIDSTNNCAKAIAGCWGEEGTVVIAEQQTAGRGRLGRVWEASPNENLMFSVVLRPKVSPSGLNLLPLYAAVAIAEAVEQTTGVSVECKWPNDILVGKRKVAGVLIEGSVKQNVVEYVVIGIGINVNQKRFVGELKTKATSLSLETGTEIDRAELFRSVLSALERHYNTIRAQGFNSIIPLWLSRTAMINKPISVSQQGTIITGVVKGLSDDGGLVLQSNGTVRTLFAGDVTIVGM